MDTRTLQMRRRRRRKKKKRRRKRKSLVTALDWTVAVILTSFVILQIRWYRCVQYCV